MLACTMNNRCALKFLVTLVVGSFATNILAATTVISSATTIDGSSSISGDHITIVDGIDGATQVDITSGGTVRGFEGQGSSLLMFDGGVSSSISGLQDNASLLMQSGTIACLEPVCLLIDYPALLVAEGSSNIRVFGGTIGGPIELRDTSTFHVYGRNLTLSVVSGSIQVEGQLASGEPGYFNIANFPSQNTIDRIFLYAVPEPASLVILMPTLLWLFRRSHRKCSH